MFDHIIQQIGHTKIFELLTANLAPLASSSRTSRPVYQPSELVASTIHILTHIAAGPPKQKQLFIAQRQLLKEWVPHFNHSDAGVRVQCVFAVNNLTYMDDGADRLGARQRMLELRNAGIETAIRNLQQDHSQDVRQRVKLALKQIEEL